MFGWSVESLLRVFLWSEIIFAFIHFRRATRNSIHPQSLRPRTTFPSNIKSQAQTSAKINKTNQTGNEQTKKKQEFLIQTDQMKRNGEKTSLSIAAPCERFSISHDERQQTFTFFI
jgi:hypothetical protein